MNLTHWQAIGILVGTTLGAGTLGLPYAIKELGMFFGILMLLFVAILVIITHMYLAEVFHTEEHVHQISGLVEKYIGRKWMFLFSLVFLFYLSAAMVAYSLGFGEIFSSLFSLPSYASSLVLFALFAWILYFRIRVFAGVELLLTGLLLLLVLVVSLLLLPSFSWYESSSPSVFLPYGVILFAFMGASSLSEVRQELSDKKDLFQVIIISLVICFMTYTLLGISIVGFSGVNTSDVFVSGLTGSIALFGYLLAFLALSTSFLSCGYALKDMFYLDIRQPYIRSWMLALLPAFLVVVFSVSSFIAILGFAGAVGGGIILLTILFLHHKVVRRTSLGFFGSLSVKFFLGCLLVLGIVSQFL